MDGREVPGDLTARETLMKKLLIALLATLALLGSGGVALAATVDDPPPANTVVDVSGDAVNGFTIEYYDGSVDYPPTRAEAHAACNERDNRVRRAVCHTQVRVTFRDLRQMKVALGYAHQK
ncbi:hypothetical protein H5V45_07260 [Nocardioides sp. KIGAM211]|uniref:Uncharacterized protein n=1 Tax=Nocardioides luti TaxID=2761101 RepID=A0A7X0VA19_9ACTN|nr:hypothetical protein [Nocardioides luti]MBB6627116.1 hypothetical protein [Nocardioides luti]